MRKSARSSTSSNAAALDAELAEALRRRRTGRSATTFICSPSARRATCWPIRPNPSTPERLVGKLDPAPLRALPAPLDERGVRLRDVAGERDEEPDRVLGGGDDVRLGRVGDDDPAPRRRVDVDVVDADARRARSPSARARARARSAVTFVAERTISASESPRIDSSGESVSTTTSRPRARSSSMPASAIGSRTTTRPVAVTPRRAFERLERAGHGHTALDLGPELGQRQLDRCERRRRCRRCRTSRCARCGRSSL